MLLAAVPAVFLAQSAPPPLSTEWQGGFITLALLTYVGLSIWEKLRRKPALEETFAGKKQSQEEDARLDRELKALDERTERRIEALDRRRESGEKENRDLIQSQIGEMKQFLTERLAENRENNTERFAALAAKLDSHQVTMQGLSNDVMHQIGRLEGQMDLSKK